MMVQIVIIALLVLHYNYSSNMAAGFLAVFSSVLYVLVGGLTPIDILWSLQAVGIPIMFAGKVITILKAYTNNIKPLCLLQIYLDCSTTSENRPQT